MSTSPTRPTSARRTWVALILAVFLLGTGIAVATGLLSGGKVARVEIAPMGVLLTATGETRRLAAQAFDTGGRPVEASISWSSSRTGTVEVNGQGSVTARAIGSVQIVAEAGGVKSAPILAVVTTPAAGVRLITDEQIVGDPVEVDPTVVPEQLDTVRAVLRDPVPAVGDLILGTGAKPLAGRVVKVEPAGGQATVTVRLVPLP